MRELPMHATRALAISTGSQDLISDWSRAGGIRYVLFVAKELHSKVGFIGTEVAYLQDHQGFETV